MALLLWAGEQPAGCCGAFAVGEVVLRERLAAADHEEPDRDRRHHMEDVQGVHSTRVSTPSRATNQLSPMVFRYTPGEVSGKYLRIETAVPEPVKLWLTEQSTRSGLTRSAHLRQLLLELYNKAKGA